MRISASLKVRKIDQASHDERVRRASAMVELDEFLHRKPAEIVWWYASVLPWPERLFVSLMYF